MSPKDARLKLWLSALVVTVACSWTNGAAAADTAGLDLEVRVSPTPVNVMGELQLVYELHVANRMPNATTLERIEIVKAARPQASVAVFAGDVLASRMAAAPASAGQGSRRTLAAGMETVVYIELTIKPGSEGLPALAHRVTAVADAPLVVEGARLAFADGAALTLGAPLGCGKWVAIYDPAWERGHRRMRYTVDGRERIPARFAIDWIRVDAAGRHARGDGSKVSDWYGHGADVLAVADGVVAAARDGMAEPASTDAPSGGPRAANDASGNFITLDLGRGRFGTYEHLKPGSLKVRAGDTVQRGQVIAALGFTGDSTGPHLHFHVSDANSVLGAEGMPYVLDRFQMLGRYASIDAFGNSQAWEPLKSASRARRRAEFPASLAVVEFTRDAKMACPG